MKRYELQDWKPLEDLIELPKLFHGWFDLPALRQSFYPSIDVIEKVDKIIVKAETPGMDKKDLNISIEENTLSIKGEKKVEHEEKKEGYYHLERKYGSFHRLINLPATVDADKVKAAYKDGVLEITMTKQEKTHRKEKQISID